MKYNKNDLMWAYQDCALMADGIFKFHIPEKKAISTVETTPNVNGIVVPLRGKAVYEIENRRYVLTQGCVLMSGGGLSLNKKVIGDEPFEYILLHYKVKPFTERGQIIEKAHFTLSIDDVAYAEILHVLEQMLLNQKRGDLSSKMRQRSFIWRLVERLLTYGFDESLTSESDKINKSMDFVLENMHSDITVSELADYLDMDVKQFSQIFVKITGITPKKYVIQQKVHHAKSLLMQTSLSVQEVAIRVGYDDPLYFSRIFKKYAGASPSLYKNGLEKSPCK